VTYTPKVVSTSGWRQILHVTHLSKPWRCNIDACIWSHHTSSKTQPWPWNWRNFTLRTLCGTNHSPDSGRVNRPRFFRKENAECFALSCWPHISILIFSNSCWLFQGQGSFNLQMVWSEIVSSDLTKHPNLSIALCLFNCIRTWPSSLDEKQSIPCLIVRTISANPLIIWRATM